MLVLSPSHLGFRHLSLLPIIDFYTLQLLLRLS